MPTELKRCYGRGDLHFVTFSCYRRWPLLGSRLARDLFVRELSRMRNEHGFQLVGYVVMPEHVHLLMGEPIKGTPSTALQVLKQRVSRKMRQQKEKLSSQQKSVAFAEDRGESGQFWQERFYDFNVYSSGKVQEKLNYMHANPVIRRLVEHPQDWPWSSWSNYAKNGEGLIAVDFV
jgi:putative transposase